MLKDYKCQILLPGKVQHKYNLTVYFESQERKPTLLWHTKTTRVVYVFFVSSVFCRFLGLHREIVQKNYELCESTPCSCAHHARSGSQSEHSICSILPAGTASDIVLVLETTRCGQVVTRVQFLHPVIHWICSPSP